MFVFRSRIIIAATAVALTLGTFGCGEKFEYTPRPAYSGPAVSIQDPPNLPQTPLKKGDAYTVWGASFLLRNNVHHKEINGQKITIEGHIVKTNLPDAPECAVHESGKADPEGCSPPVPTFWVCDGPNDKLDECIQVMGWVSNFAQVWKAIEHFEKTEKEEKPEPVLDDYWGKEIPRPLPAKGGQAKVTGTYSTTFTGASRGTAADPIMGILTFQEMQWIKEPPEPATLPGMEEKK